MLQVLLDCSGEDEDVVDVHHAEGQAPRIMSIVLWKVAPALRSPKQEKLNVKVPKGVVTAVFGISLGAIGI